MLHRERILDCTIQLLHTYIHTIILHFKIAKNTVLLPNRFKMLLTFSSCSGVAQHEDMYVMTLKASNSSCSPHLVNVPQIVEFFYNLLKDVGIPFT